MDVHISIPAVLYNTVEIRSTPVLMGKVLLYVTGFAKTRKSRNACFVKVQFLSYSCQKNFLLTIAVAYGG